MLSTSHIKYIPVSFLLIILIESVVKTLAADHGGETETEHYNPKILRYQIATVDFKHVEKAFMISIWMLLASLARLGFYISPTPSNYFPESCMLLLLGVLSGLVLFFSRIQGINYTISTSLFFLFLLPPIVLDAGYFMSLRPFFENIGTILLLAIVGTIWNTFATGLSLWGIAKTGMIGVDVPLMHCLLFSSLISAVDPVAILSVFEEANVLYNLFGSFSEIGLENIITKDIIFGMISFGVVSLGGTLIGILFGIFTGWLTKYTHKIRIIEPLFVFLLAYLSYIVADMFTLSGILAIVFCGLIMRPFVEANISLKSNITVKYTMKTLSSICESIIFLFLGLSAVVDVHVWNIAFTSFTLFFCLIFRAIGILLLIPLINRYRLVKLNKVDIFILTYGGLRGAISFSLALLLSESVVGQYNKRMFVTTTMTVVIFTSFFQGLTIRPLLEFLSVKKAQDKDKNMGTILFARCIDHLLAGVEDILGNQGKNRLREKIELFQYKYLQPYLVKKASSREDNLVHICKKLNKDETNELLKQYHGDINALKQGLTICHLVDFLRAKKESTKDKNMKNTLLERGFEYLLAEIEDFIGHKGNQISDPTMVDESQDKNMPVVNISKYPVYTSKEEANKWYSLVEDVLHPRGHQGKKYSRRMLFHNPSLSSIQATPSNQHILKLKTSPLFISPHKRGKLFEKSNEHVKSKEFSKYYGIPEVLSRFFGMTSSPSQDLVAINKRNGKRAKKNYDNDFPVDSPTTSSDIFRFNALTETLPGSLLNRNQHVNSTLLPIKEIEKYIPRLITSKKLTNGFGSRVIEVGTNQEKGRLIENDIDTDTRHRTLSLINASPLLQPMKATSLTPKFDKKSALPYSFLSQTGTKSLLNVEGAESEESFASAMSSHLVRGLPVSSDLEEPTRKKDIPNKSIVAKAGVQVDKPVSKSDKVT
ncbi:probable Na(+)/H(+) antiporter nhx-9 isoform X2 [Gordionus sp. m RMFG-2023]|uniref:probable Na(+)/H(+) antiporter nhx-9 isoform X2 n=1 Tax=Gordionus sp. m RMFG-2023 TaxID=3053472 RepID=UPI0031FBC5ED